MRKGVRQKRTMEKHIIQLHYEAAESMAKEYFIQVSGLGADTEKHRELLAEGLQVLENCRSGLRMIAVLIPMDSKVFRDSTIFWGRSQFTCTAFHQISDQEVIGIFAYLLSLGECKSGVKNQAEQYYADLWGNGFLEAGRQLLRDEIKRMKAPDFGVFYVSGSYGPGFYGMPLSLLDDLVREMNGSSIGILSDQSGDDSHQKFCGGFFFITDREGVLPAEECRDCIGHEGGCLFCGGRNLIPSRETCMDLLCSYGTPPHVIRHCAAVSETAIRIARALMEKGEDLDLSLLEASCLLHDIARVEENHGVKGAILAEKQGYHQVANLIRCHMFYATDPYKSKITEQDLLCLADRMVMEDRYVGLDDRMQYVLDKLTAAGIDTERVRHRMEENRLVKERIEKIIDRPIDDLMK